MNTTDVEVDLDDLPWRHALIAVPCTVPNLRADLLATLFAGQEELRKKYEAIEKRNGAPFPSPEQIGDLDDREVQMSIKDLMWRCTEELGEAANCLKNKPWKNTFAATDVAHFEEEMADALHFFIGILLVAGITAEEIFLLYFKKHLVNSFRQETNY